MLTKKHLAVVRAALKFLDEEMGPNGSEALFHYLDERGKACNAKINDVVDAHKFFSKVELSYALVDATGVVIESERLVPATSNDELNFQSDLSLVASVLVPIR